MLWWCSKVHFHSSSSPQSVLQYTNARHWRSSPPLLGVSSSARIAAAVRVINMSEDESRIWWDSVCLSLQRIRPICCTTWPWMLSLLASEDLGCPALNPIAQDLNDMELQIRARACGWTSASNSTNVHVARWEKNPCSRLPKTLWKIL